MHNILNLYTQNMKHRITYILYSLFLINTIGYGQYQHDHTLKNNPFLNKAAPENDKTCSLYSSYYERLAGQNLNGTGIDCYVFQEQIKDTLRARFTDQELFEIAQYSKIPFYRIAAFELYSQTNYSKKEVIHFLKPEKTLSLKDLESNSEMYVPLPTPFLAGKASVRFKMLEMIDPTAKRMILHDTLGGSIAINSRRYPKSKPLDLESFVSVNAYLTYYGRQNTAGAWPVTVKNGKADKIPAFYLPFPMLDFGTIDLSYLDSNKTNFELRGNIKIINTTSKSITVNGQASAHTMCTNSQYVIAPNQEMMIEFKSLVDLRHPYIDRIITLTHAETGGAQVFKFKAKFIHNRE
jgi:hypothetical protein